MVKGFSVTSEMRTYDLHRDCDEVFVTVACPCGGEESVNFMVSPGHDITSDLDMVLMEHIKRDVAEGKLSKEWLDERLGN